METLYTVHEAAEYLKVGIPTMYKYMDRGVRGVTLRYTYAGGERRIPQSAIDTFLVETTAAAAAAAATGRPGRGGRRASMGEVA